MNLYDFNRGSQEESAAWLCQEGTFLADRNCQGNKVCLYHMGEFYAEVYYRVWDNQVYLVKAFKNENLLKPYLNKISLP